MAGAHGSSSTRSRTVRVQDGLREFQRDRFGGGEVGASRQDVTAVTRSSGSPALRVAS
jgi:hypothetical protein